MQVISNLDAGPLDDAAWDSFVATSPNGHLLETSRWGALKARFGWGVQRVALTDGNAIVAAARVLMRSLPLAGAMGYVPRGPLFALDDPVLTRLVIDELHQVARAHRVQYLVVEPPCNGEALAHQLPGWGFRPSAIRMAQATATVLIDLTMDLDDILAQMRKKTRYCIRRGLRERITVREGTERDLHTFYRLGVATSRRHGFFPFPEAYFAEMRHVFASYGYIRLFLAEYEDEAVSAQVVLPFGDTVLAKHGGWSGHHGHRRPNEVLE